MFNYLLSLSSGPAEGSRPAEGTQVAGVGILVVEEDRRVAAEGSQAAVGEDIRAGQQQGNQEELHSQVAAEDNQAAEGMRVAEEGSQGQLVGRLAAQRNRAIVEDIQGQLEGKQAAARTSEGRP